MEDNPLGLRLHTINLRRTGVLTQLIVVTIIVVVLDVIGMFQLVIALSLIPFALIPIVNILIDFVLTFGNPDAVEVFENGIVVHARARHETILWRDVVGVQISRIVDTYHMPTLAQNFTRLFLFRWEMESVAGQPRPLHECRYVFRMSDDSQFELRGDLRLFGLMDEIKAKVLSKLVPEAIKKFEAGKAVPLAEGVTYSKDGIHGTLIRKTRHARREIPLDLHWSDIKRLYRNESIFRITSATGQSIVIPMSEIINAQAFLKVLADLRKKELVPPLI